MRKQSGEVLRFIHRSAHLFVRVKSRLRMCLAGHGKWCRRWPCPLAPHNVRKASAVCANKWWGV